MKTAKRKHKPEVFPFVPRDAEGVPCACNGYADRVDLTPEEIGAQSCRRTFECCGRAFVCRLCKTRLLRDAEPPEMG